jgi:hypothetical protein
LHYHSAAGAGDQLDLKIVPDAFLRSFHAPLLFLFRIRDGQSPILPLSDLAQPFFLDVRPKRLPAQVPSVPVDF